MYLILTTSLVLNYMLLCYLRGMLILVGIRPVSSNSFGSRTSISNTSGLFGRSLTSSYVAILLSSVEQKQFTTDIDTFNTKIKTNNLSIIIAKCRLTTVRRLQTEVGLVINNLLSICNSNVDFTGEDDINLFSQQSADYKCYFFILSSLL